MYLQYFGLNEAPFSITPDPAFVYLSPEHREALAHLLYGVGQGGSGGFVQLTGEVGTGKTTLCRCLLEQLPADTRVALVLNPLLTPRELLATICEELGIRTTEIADSNKAMVDALNRYLLEQHAGGHRVVVVIDEAQNLSPDALEQVRLLTNLETPKEKLLQMVLLGQPELRQLLQRQDLRQLAQRITARYHLAPLDEAETAAYVRHRMKVAGAQRNPFTRSALRALYRRSGGVPRLINIIADRALAGAYGRETVRVTARLVHAAADEVQPGETRIRANPWRGVAATAAGLLLVVVSLFLWRGGYFEPVSAEAPPPVVASVSDAPAAAVDVSDPSVPPPADPPASSVDAGPPDTAPVEPDSPPAYFEPDADWLRAQHLTAWEVLAELWREPGAGGAIQSACDGVAGTGFACLRESGNWSRIRQLGLPVILVLRGDAVRLLPLRGFRDDGLLVGSPREDTVVARSTVESLWFGEFLVAWPQAPDWPVELRRGAAGPAVDIVMRLASFAEPPWEGGGVFDAEFENWLLGFQRRNGLVPDGIVGPNTLLHLMAPTIDRPQLVIESGAES
ncbi:MAG: AAA family ATPase [Xanthomonadales bacterium]